MFNSGLVIGFTSKLYFFRLSRFCKFIVQLFVLLICTWRFVYVYFKQIMLDLMMQHCLLWWWGAAHLEEFYLCRRVKNWSMSKSLMSCEYWYLSCRCSQDSSWACDIQNFFTSLEQSDGQALTDTLGLAFFLLYHVALDAIPGHILLPSPQSNLQLNVHPF